MTLLLFIAQPQLLLATTQIPTKNTESSISSGDKILSDALPQSTSITLTFSLNGIPKPLQKNTQRSREIIAEIADSASPNTRSLFGYGEMILDPTTSSFFGNITFDEQAEPGVYTMSIKIPKYASRQVPSAFIVTPDGNATMTMVRQPIRLFAGDSDEDGSLTIFDYNLLLGCLNTLNQDEEKPFCSPELLNQTDLNEDGVVNQLDYNILLRSLRESVS